MDVYLMKNSFIWMHTLKKLVVTSKSVNIFYYSQIHVGIVSRHYHNISMKSFEKWLFLMAFNAGKSQSSYKIGKSLITSLLPWQCPNLQLDRSWQDGRRSEAQKCCSSLRCYRWWSKFNHPCSLCPKISLHLCDSSCC